MSAWGFPQWILAVLIAIELSLAFILDGQPRPNYSACRHGLAVAILLVLLWWGGFWS
ncbi:hypothetical protein [Antarcticirhabdus aurantiaca]|uniref:Uncharacterized protein n=1 Tax=Antarcticirhabdus aurantiaca TaxID=2606717 RepID=A0ACD4NJ59_9HYPH|nr:hypothetical protein OXU80_18725 [Jeongeuplla avenae]